MKRLLACCLILAVAGTGSVFASDVQKGKFPSKPITVIVPYAPGGSSDLIARVVAKVSPKYLNGQTMVIVNKPGGSSNIGLMELVNSPADGYTIGITNNAMVTQPLFGNTQVNYPDVLDAVGQAGTIPYILAVNAEAPYKTLEEFVAFAKKSGSVKFAHTGIGNATHITGERFAMQAGFKMVPVTFDGGSKAVAAVLGGHVDCTVQTPLDVKELFKAGKLRVLAGAGDKRIEDPLFKDVPTFREKGFDVKIILWQGLGLPAKAPADAKKILADGFKNIMNDKEASKAISDLGLMVDYLGPADFKKVWHDEQAFMKKFMTDTGIFEMIKSQKK